MTTAGQSLDHYIYQVHPSYKSQTAIRITRKPVAPLQTPAHKPQQQNPYIYKPKSYSKKRIFNDESNPTYTPPQPSKKIKTTLSPQLDFNLENNLDGKYISKLLNQSMGNYFNQSFRGSQKIEEQHCFKLPLDIETSLQIRKNPQLSHKIEIVSTENNKLLVSIHEGLLKANTNHSKQEQTLEGIINPFNSKLKNHYSNKISFIREYKSGYAPIELQNRSKKDDQGGYEDTKKSSKSHFIKKKQSTLSLPRTCGVSYIKASQSFQSYPYEPLPPLIFQCSTSCQYSHQLRQLYEQHITSLIHLSQNRWLPVIITNQEHMRDLLLGKPFGKVAWVEGIMNLWPLFNQGTFIMIFFQEQWAGTEEQVWQQFNTCYFRFGILTKRSTSGKKLFLKSIQGQSADKEETMSLKSVETVNVNEQMKPEEPICTQPLGSNEPKPFEQKKLEDSPEQRKQCKNVCEEFMKELKNTTKVLTMSVKFQMYIHEMQWKMQDKQGKNLLNAVIHSFQEYLQKKAIEVIIDRLSLCNPTQRQQLLLKASQKIRIGNSITHFNDNLPYIQLENHKFTIGTVKSLVLALQNRITLNSGIQIPVNQFFKDKQGKQNQNVWEKSLKMPIYYISTRDSFAFDLVENITLLKRGDRTYKKIVYHFQHDNVPDNFGEYKKLFPDLKIGVTSYHDFFSQEELQLFEAKTLETEKSAFKNKFLQMTVQPTIVGNRIKRTKFFFGYRYMWTRCQLAEPNSYVGAGVRRDVTPAPKWLKNVENPMVQNNILQPNFLNSCAINVYHDGSEGLAQHFDDAVRFKQPIYTIRLVSDGRLSFGSQFYGFCNGAFIIPLPRGCICVMEENSYAANGVKHCVRPCDMAGKSAAVILRQMHHQVINEASKYDELIDFPSWLSTLSEDSRATTFAEQKRREAEEILMIDQLKKQKQKVNISTVNL